MPLGAVIYRQAGIKERHRCIDRCRSLLDSSTVRHVTAGVWLAEALTAASIGGDFDEIGISLAKLLIIRLTTYWIDLKAKLSTEQPTATTYQQ